MQRTGVGSDVDDGVLVDAVLSASRALVAVAARSLAAVDEDVTLPQYRVLIVLAEHGPQRLLDLAGALEVNPSTATRMCDRLAGKGLIDRDRSVEDRREVRVALGPTGRALVEQVSRRRRVELATVLAVLPAEERTMVTTALRAFAAAAGEVSEKDWAGLW